jgi:carbonic anhydrase
MQKLILLSTILCLLIKTSFADEGKTNHEHPDLTQVVHSIFKNIESTHKKYIKNFNKFLTPQTLNKQSPKMTALICSDSRISTNAFDATPEGDIFTVRNIGNQIETTEGSIEFGVTQLHTPILLVLGHSNCGAIEAAMGNYSNLPSSIQNELDTLQVQPNQPLKTNIVKNVNDQVNHALAKFQSQVDNGDLVIIGIVYDMHNNFNFGHGQLIVTNINGITEPLKLKKHIYFKELHGFKTLPSSEVN